MKFKDFYRLLSTIALMYFFITPSTFAQTEVMAWGNMTGIRVDGELMEFESSFRVVETDWSRIYFTARERNTTNFVRTDGIAKVNSSVRFVTFEQTVEDKSRGTVAVALSYQSDTTRRIEGAFYCFELPAKRYAAGTVKIGNTAIAVSGLIEDSKQLKMASGRQITIEAPGRNIKIDFSSTVSAFVRKEAGNAVVYVQLLNGNQRKGAKGRLNFTITATGNINSQPVEVIVDRTKPGRLFTGMGGNFRLQNPTTDPQVIDYCLKNTRVAMGRVEMPWATWDPDENGDPLADARNGKINDRIHGAMQMAQRLAAMGMPVVVSAWFPPNWAIDTVRTVVRGRNYVLPNKAQRMYKSIADYLVCLKELYGVEAYAYSFNESDIGINVMHTAQEHADFIKGFGAYVGTRGLATRMLLGDTGDANGFPFILPALNDPTTHKYIAAVSFHSWRGCDDVTLKKWSDAARQLNVPLIIGEGSTDAAAHRYPQIFLESTFALYEINLYIRICAISQPLTILQWQYTADYSLLVGGGIFRTEGPLRPTQRFWNIRQLADTPEQVFALPFTCNKEEVNCAAFGNIARNEYAVHLVNNGAGRTATIKGLPNNLSDIKAFATNYALSRQEMKVTKASDGTLSVELPPIGFVTVIAK